MKDRTNHDTAKGRTRVFESDRLEGWRLLLHDVIFDDATTATKAFDTALAVVILASVLAVMLESVEGFNTKYHELLFGLEWAFTVVFTVEYILRLACVGRPAHYARSFFGIIDLLAVLPTYFMWLLPGAQTLVVIRLLRIVRVLRVLKLAHYVEDMDIFAKALRRSASRLVIFVTGVLTLVTILGSLMYLIEGQANGFDSIPRSIYWAIVTLTTVGYGDISPVTPLGQSLAAVVMILGYAIIAVAAGYIMQEIVRFQENLNTPNCDDCGEKHHMEGSDFCRMCGEQLPAI